MNDLLDVKLSNFEGPLDLLIHLIYKNEMSIYDISISQIADQFIQTINEFEQLDMEIAAEFIQMASYLIYLKSKMLLPKTSGFEDEIDPEEEKFIFTQKLIEYSFYKDISNMLKEKEHQSNLYLTRTETVYLPKDEKITEDPQKIASFFFGLLVKDEPVKMVVEKNTIDVNQIISQIKDIVFNKHEIFWSEITGKLKNKREIVVSLLAILELIKLKVIIAIQNKNFDDFLVRKYE
jgi:segregation and condensation protein A